MAAEGKKPDYKLTALDKVTGLKTSWAGVAWKRSDGSIHIRLNPFVVLDGSNPNLVVSLFKFDQNGPSFKKESIVDVEPELGQEDTPF